MSNPAAPPPTRRPRGSRALHRDRHVRALWSLLDAQEVALAAGLTVAISIAITADFTHATLVRPAAYLFAVGFGALMLIRNRAPQTILAMTILGVFVYYAIGFPPIGVALPALAALYSAAETGHTRTAVVGGAVLLAVSAYFRIQQEELSTSYLFSYDVLTNFALVAAGITLGVNVRTRRNIREHQRQLREMTAVEVRQTAEAQMQTERLRIARDLHDAVGHCVSVIALHSNVAREAIGRDDAAATRAVVQVQHTATATMRDLRATVHLLRSPTSEPPQTGPAGLAGLERLVGTARDVGIDVTLRLEVDPATLPAAIDVTAFRIVQEAVTNMIRHSGADHGTITARRVGDTVRIDVTDDGRGPGREQSPRSGVAAGQHGQGIVGMCERAALLGGTVTTGPRAGGGFIVRAELPAGPGT